MKKMRTDKSLNLLEVLREFLPPDKRSEVCHLLFDLEETCRDDGRAQGMNEAIKLIRKDMKRLSVDS